MSVFHNNALIGAGGGAAAAAVDANITKSLRFNSGDSGYLDRTPSSAGNRKTWTWSGWIKRTKNNDGANYRHWIFIGGNTASNTGIGFIGFKQNDDLLVCQTILIFY